MTFPNPLAADDPLDAATLNVVFNALENAVVGQAESYVATFFPDEFTVLNGNAIALTLHGSINEVYGHQNAAAINDEWQHGAYLSADDYTLTVRVIKSSSSGILKVSIDDVVVATIDLYAAADAVSNQTQASIAIATTGWHTVKGLVDSKNASSSGYACNIVKMHLRGDSA